MLNFVTNDYQYKPVIKNLKIMKEKYFTKDNIFKVSNKIKAEAVPYNKYAGMPILSSNSCLLVLDMQNYFLFDSSHAFIPSAEAILPKVDKLIYYFEKKKRPVYFSQHWNNLENSMQMSKKWNSLLEKDNLYFEIYQHFNLENKIVFEKNQFDAFYKTIFETELKKNNIQQIVICGVMTHLCCETTVRSAFVRGFEPIFPIDTTATYNLKFHKNTFINLSHGFITPLLSEELLNE